MEEKMNAGRLILKRVGSIGIAFGLVSLLGSILIGMSGIGFVIAILGGSIILFFLGSHK
jgi:hypothetical protein